MAKQKRLNKNLVAFLTIMGMVVILSLAFLVIRQTAQRDPQRLAAKAAELEWTGKDSELAQAARLYGQAFIASNESDMRYVLDMARCEFRAGGIQSWLEALQRANAKDPSNAQVLTTILEGLWRLREVEGRGFWWDRWEDFADKLLVLDSDNVLALVCRAYGLVGQSDEDLTPARADVQRAYELAPTDPRVAVARAEFRLAALPDELEQARAGGAGAAEQRRLQSAAADEARALLQAALKEHPDDLGLVLSYARFAQQMFRDLQSTDAPAAEALLAETGQLLEAAITQTESALADTTGNQRMLLSGRLPELHLALARNFAGALDSPATAEADREALLERMRQHATRATELDPAMYDAWTLLAELQGFGGAATQPALDLQEAVLAKYEEAAQATLMLDGLRARLTEGDRMQLMERALRTALGCVELSRQSAPERSTALQARAQALLADAETRWPENALTQYMQGEAALSAGDAITAIKAYERAVARENRPGWWLDAARVLATPAERLALLYTQQRQLGEADRQSQIALEQYETQLRRYAPARLVVNRADVLNQLDRSAEALALLDRYVSAYPQERLLQAARATTLTRLNRHEDAARAVEQVNVPGAATDLRLWQARLAVQAEDYATAEKLAREVTADASVNDGQFQSAFFVAMAAMERTNRLTEAQEYVRQLRRDAARPVLAQLLEAYEILLTETDPTVRDAKFEQLINAMPDPVVRAERYRDFYEVRRQFDKALTHVQELRKLQPDDMQHVESEFNLRLRIGQQLEQDGQPAAAAAQFDQAAPLVALLTRARDGQGEDFAGGALYRGRLAMARGDAERAISEFRQGVLMLPRSSELDVLLARAYLVAGRAGEGLEALKRAVASNPQNVDAWLLLTHAHDELAGKSFGAERTRHQADATAAFENLARLAPSHSFVRERRQRAAEDAAPLDAIAQREQRRAAQPDDLDNLARLADLYLRAWETGDEATRAKLRGPAETFYSAAVAQTTGARQFEFARRGANFYAQSEQRDRGERFLREEFRDRQEGAAKVGAQLLLAWYLERLPDPAAAQHEYQRAQALVGEAVQDPAERTRLDMRVGLAFIEFYERWAQPGSIVEVCRWLLDRLPREAEAIPLVRMKLIDALLKNGQLADAEAEINNVVQTRGTDVALLTNRARLCLARNQRDAAEQDLNALLKLEPNNAWALIARGWLALQRARFDQARADLESARELVPPGAPLEPRLRLLLANLYERTRQDDRAIEQLKAQLDTLVGQPDADEEEEQKLVAAIVRLYGRSEQLDRAQQLISEYMERFPTEPSWPYQLGRLLSQRADTAKDRDAAATRRDYLTAAGYFQRAAEKCGRENPNAMARALAESMHALRKGGQPREALGLFDKLPFGASPGLRQAAGRCFWDLNDRERALEQYQLALLDAARLGAIAVGEVSKELREVLQQDAEPVLQEAATRTALTDEAGQRVRIAQAEFLAAFNRPDEGLTLLAAVEQAARPGSPEHLTALLARAMIQDRQGQPEAAAATYRKALEHRPDHLLALNNLAYLLVSAQGPGFPQPQEALQYAERLAGLVGEDVTATNVLDTIGWVYYHYAMSAPERRGYLDQALAALEQSLSVDDSIANLPAFEHKAQVFLALGRRADAREAYSRARDTARSAQQAAQRERRERDAQQYQQAVDRLTEALNKLS